MSITVVLPISRISYLDRVIESLSNQTHKPNNLIAIFDGNEHEFVYVRNKIVQLSLDNIICVPSTNYRPVFTIQERRHNIVNIHNQARQLIDSCDYVFSIEDDGILQENALERLVTVIDSMTMSGNNVGIATGVELGRWGIPYVGLWRVDDVSSPRRISSLDSRSHTDELEEVDGAGLYCTLIKADLYKTHQFYTSNGLGPDVNLGLYCRKLGYKNYVDWGVHVTHLTNDKGIEKEIYATDQSCTVSLELYYGNVWVKA